MAAVRVELRGAALPWIGWLAHHYWLVIEENGRQERWEVWQHPDRAPVCRGHVHRDLLPVYAGVGGGESWQAAVWEGSGAVKIAERVRNSMEAYPWCNRYRYWPGPNSNTYVQWVLQDCFRLPRKAIGRSYRVKVPEDI